LRRSKRKIDNGYHDRIRTPIVAGRLSNGIADRDNDPGIDVFAITNFP